jgi:hypothetical protein
MFKEIIDAVRRAGAAMVERPLTVMLAFLLYLGLAGLIYLFVVIKDASLWQLALSVAAIIAALCLFFSIQSLAVGYTKADWTSSGALLKRIGKDALAMLAISLPLLVVVVAGLLILGLLGSLVNEAAVTASKWSIAARGISALRMILLYLVLPLVAIQLWIAATRDGLHLALKGFLKSTVRAFSPRSLLTYLLISFVFGAIAYFLISTRTPVGMPGSKLGCS